MAETISKRQYFIFTLPDRPGEGARAAATLQQEGINVLALLSFPRRRKMQVEVVPEDPKAFRAVARRAGWSLEGPKTCFLVVGDDRPGALVDTLQRLGGADVNVTATAATVAGQGRFGAIIWVDPKSVRKAAKVLGAGSWLAAGGGIS